MIILNIQEKYEKLLFYFKEISKVPRNSRHEEKIANYLCDFAGKLGLWHIKDENNNVLIKKKANKGYEDRKTILFQAHTDMVCEKTINSVHDFENDAIEIIEKNGVFKAKDTTLGADDGIGVAYLMLLLADEDIKLPSIECLFTTEEEIGMNGARSFDYSNIDAQYLINLDGEEENTAIVGCAGGVSVYYTKLADMEDELENVYKLSISGLFGGHSGVDIDKGRINSNYLAAKILNNIENVKLVSFVGGNKDNAIANAAEVVFSTNMKDLDESLNNVLENIEVTDADKNLTIDIEEIEYKGKCMTKEESTNIITLILNLKQNVIEYSKDVKGLVETSGNVGIVNIKEGQVLVLESLRSSIDKRKEEVKLENNNLAISLGFNIKEEGEYPGWKYNPNSKLEKTYIDAYKKNHNEEEPIVCAIHAGVECGMIYEKLPHLDMISLGPDVKDVHTVNETLYLDSCKLMLKTLLDMIENLD